jgi:hypothetical protein
MLVDPRLRCPDEREREIKSAATNAIETSSRTLPEQRPRGNLAKAFCRTLISSHSTLNRGAGRLVHGAARTEGKAHCGLELTSVDRRLLHGDPEVPKAARSQRAAVEVLRRRAPGVSLSAFQEARLARSPAVGASPGLGRVVATPRLRPARHEPGITAALLDLAQTQGAASTRRPCRRTGEDAVSTLVEQGKRPSGRRDSNPRPSPWQGDMPGIRRYGATRNTWSGGGW